MFDGTIESLTEWADDLPIEREVQIRQLLTQYEQSLETSKQPETDLLQQAYQAFQHCLREHVIDRELAHLAVAFSHHCHNWAETAHIIALYRQEQDLTPYEQAWAWWHYVDALALLQEASSAIEEQRTLIAWVQEVLPPIHRLFSVADTTQALTWAAQGQETEWFAHSQTLLAQTPVQPASRLDRFLTMRSMFTMALRLQKWQQAETFLMLLDTLLLENAQWQRKTELSLEIAALRLAWFNGQKDQHHVYTLGVQAVAHCLRLVAQWQHPTLCQRRSLRRLAHNVGAELYEARQYALALPLLELAAHLGATTPYTYLWLAGCIWICEQDRQRVEYLLQQARARDTATNFPIRVSAIPELSEYVSSNGFGTNA